MYGTGTGCSFFEREAKPGEKMRFQSNRTLNGFNNPDLTVQPTYGVERLYAEIQPRLRRVGAIIVKPLFGV